MYSTDLTVLTAAYRPDLDLLALAGQSIAKAYSGSIRWLIALDSGDDQQQNADVQSVAEESVRDGAVTVSVQGQPFRGGAGTTRTVALSSVRTRWVTVLDCDDLFPDGSLDLQMEKLSSHPEAMWCVGSGETLHADGTIRFWGTGLTEVLQAGDVARRTRDEGSMPTMPISGIWDTNSVRALGGWQGLPRDQDTSLKLAITSIAPGVSVPESVYVYRRDLADQVTAAKNYGEMGPACRAASLDRLMGLVSLGLAPSDLADGDWSTFLSASV